MANSTAYGFITIKDLMAERVQDNLPIVQTAITESILEYQRQLDAMMSLLVERVTVYSQRYQLPGTGTLQPIDQHGNPLPVLPSGYYDVAFPIQGGAIAWGDNRVTRALMTIEQANRFTLTVQNADLDWLARHILAAIFTNVTWSYTDDDHGALTIQPLANGDAVAYTFTGGTSGTDNHYLFQAAAIADATNPYPTIEAELSEHPSNSGATIIAYIPTALKATTKALANFVPVSDPDVVVGVNTERLSSMIAEGFGDEVLGKVDGVWIVEWKRLPSATIFALAQGADPVVGMREYPAASIQGLFPEFQDIDGNRHLQKYIRFAGFGIRNRVGAVAMTIGAGAYAVPTGYLAPLAV